MTSLESTAVLMESADDQMALITQKLDGIVRGSMDISSFILADPILLSDLKVHLSSVQTLNTVILRVKYAKTTINP